LNGSLASDEIRSSQPTESSPPPIAATELSHLASTLLPSPQRLCERRMRTYLKLKFKLDEIEKSSRAAKAGCRVA